MDTKGKEQTTVKLSRIIAPAHVKIVPLSHDPEADLTQAADPANASDAPKPEAAPDKDAFAKVAPPEPPNNTLRNLTVSACGLAVVIAALLAVTYWPSTPVQEAAQATAPTPEAEAEADPIASDVSQAPPAEAQVAAIEASASEGAGTQVATAPERTEIAALPLTADVPRSPVPALRPVPQPELQAQAEDAASQDPEPTPALAAEPLRILDVEPTAAAAASDIETLSQTTSAPIEAAPSTASLSLLDQVTLGTVDALRRPVPDLPTANESAIFGFVRSLNPSRRPSTEIASMLGRAHAAGTLDIPERYLLPNGRVNIGAILTEMERQQ